MSTHFLNLPAELRNAIYHYAMDNWSGPDVKFIALSGVVMVGRDPDPVIDCLEPCQPTRFEPYACLRRESEQRGYFPQVGIRMTPLPPITMVSQQTRMEALGLFLERGLSLNLCGIGTLEALEMWLSKADKWMRMALVSVQSVEVLVEASCLIMSPNFGTIIWPEYLKPQFLIECGEQGTSIDIWTRWKLSKHHESGRSVGSDLQKLLTRYLDDKLQKTARSAKDKFDGIDLIRVAKLLKTLPKCANGIGHFDAVDEKEHQIGLIGEARRYRADSISLSKRVIKESFGEDDLLHVMTKMAEDGDVLIDGMAERQPLKPEKSILGGSSQGH